MDLALRVQVLKTEQKLTTDDGDVCFREDTRLELRAKAGWYTDQHMTRTTRVMRADGPGRGMILLRDTP